MTMIFDADVSAVFLKDVLKSVFFRLARTAKPYRFQTVLLSPCKFNQCYFLSNDRQRSF